MDGFNLVDQFPTIITPQNQSLTFSELTYKLQQHKKALEQILLKRGGLLFRDFPVHSADDFANFIEALDLGKFVNYVGGDSPRDKVAAKVYTSTEAPPEIHLGLHQEMSFIKKFPKHIYFFCEIAPQVGGETIIADARRVYAALDDNVKQRFHSRGLTYTSHYFHKSKIMDWVNSLKRSHKSWPEVFETTSKEEVEKRCVDNEFAWKWLKRDWLEIQQTRPALLQHPITNETVWFNQAHLYDFNPKHLGWKNYIAAKLFYFQKFMRLHEIAFADGATIPRKDLYHIMDTLHANTVAFPWKKGDVMVLDNILSMHGRAPFKGPRRILTALTM
jgi:alpha-ketoglutarate-dependent taurine dioxygenase